MIFTPFEWLNTLRNKVYINKICTYCVCPLLKAIYRSSYQCHGIDYLHYKNCFKKEYLKKTMISRKNFLKVTSKRKTRLKLCLKNGVISTLRTLIRVLI